ncbi:hypothetical protein [Methylocella silvestris]|uniref:hypothetical protein n=1 Tax=Methylocella silvestris TaxID=199596 RepID=UPI0011AED46C|nr:hypothetical protein [Methylocella silvestris]
MTHFNEGKACDAVIRRIEAREGCSRHSLSYPEKENHFAPVECTCLIGDQHFALEHTGIEPFEKSIKLKVKEQAHFQPIRHCLKGQLPATEHFVLHVPNCATLKLKQIELERVQQHLIAWVKSIASTLPIARLDDYVIDTKYTSIPGVPFDVALHRVQKGGPLGEISTVHFVDRNLENQRTDRIRRAYAAKTKKLSYWQKCGVRGVLIFEESDSQLTNYQRVADAVRRVEEDAIDKPDEIYLLSSAVENSWQLYTLRLGSNLTKRFSALDNSSIAIDPRILRDITAG